MQAPEEYPEGGWAEGGMTMPGWYSMAAFPWGAMPQGGAWRKGPARSHGQHPKQKHRFCATWPNIGRCRHGPNCAFAHSRDEITAPLLSEEEEAYAPHSLTDEFFTERFKTLWCPIGAQHDWQTCMYAHTYQDARRPPSIGYGHQLCPFWNKKDTSLGYSQRCPLGPRCPHAHGAKEQLYHPHYFRTLICRDLQRGRCPRGELCAFYHKTAESRKVGPDVVNYSVPLPKENLPADWLESFLNPPRFQEATGEEAGLMDMGGLSAAPYLPMMGAAKWMGGFEEEEDAGEGEEDDGEGKGARRQDWSGMDEASWAAMGGYEGYEGMFPGAYSAGSYMDPSAAYSSQYKW